MRRSVVVVSVLFSLATAAMPLAAAVKSIPPPKIFGSRPALVSSEPYAGPPVLGDVVTHVPFLAALPAGVTSHAVRIDIIDSEIEIAPGVRFKAWTFGGSVPGPVVHVREGDRVEFTMTNRSAESVVISPVAGDSPFLFQLAADDLQKRAPAEAPMKHSMDFHAGTVAPNDKWRSIDPGQTIRFDFVANYPGVFLYHCGQPPVLLHMAMGQYGVVVVSPREGFPTDALVNREYVVVQSEFFLAADESGVWSTDFEAALAKRPSHVVFNGHMRAHIDHPLTALAGERVRLYVLNAGPTDTSSFHVIGTIFDRVYYEGNPANEMRGMQTVLLGASNGAVVEFVVPEDGEYPFVDHEFADATLGAVGKLRAGPPPALAAPDQH
ncbi:MAG: multicopper oxidase domain-containing protein [Thermoanaerobaculia bacterium]